MTRLDLDAIERLAAAALRAAGAGEAAAAPVAAAIRRAEADGIGSVGLGYLPTYLAHLRSGKVDGRAEPRLSQPRPAALLVDAAHGFAHPAFETGKMALAEAARRLGTASLSISRSYSIGVLGHPVEDLAMMGLVALAVTNSPPNIAPWGGRTALFGTNPMALAAPRAKGPPLVIDQASSVVTKVALVAAAQRGEALPPDWALDAAGRPTTEPKAALQGTMLPFGGAKGAGVALLVELLAAALTGANLSRDASRYALADGPPPGVGQLFVAFDPEAFAPGFQSRVEDLASAMLAQEGVRLPGDRRLAARALAERDGVAVEQGLLDEIARLAGPNVGDGP